MPDKIEWSAPEYAYYSKNGGWFLTTGFIALMLFFWAIWTKNFLFVILIGLGYFLLVAFALKRPEEVYVSLKPKGIHVNTKLYKFDDLNSFWIFYNPPEIKELSLHSKKKMTPYITIPFNNQNPVEIRNFLINYIPEKKQDESLIDNLFRSWRF